MKAPRIAWSIEKDSVGWSACAYLSRDGYYISLVNSLSMGAGEMAPRLRA